MPIEQKLSLTPSQLVILGIFLVSALAGWFAYDAMMAPRWMRDFGLDMAARAKIVSTPSQITAFSTLKGRPDPDNPYICLRNVTSFDWDRVYFVGSGGQVADRLSLLDWDGEDLFTLNSRMKNDSRYQLIAFEHDGRVIEHGFYYTLWADLSRLADPKGLSKDQAVFLAESDGETYSLTLADPKEEASCP